MNPIIVYEWFVHPDADTPVEPGAYLLGVREGGTYRNLASRRKYTILETTPERIRYEYTRYEGERVERVGEPDSLAVVEAVGDTRTDTPTGIIDFTPLHECEDSGGGEPA